MRSAASSRHFVDTQGLPVTQSCCQALGGGSGDLGAGVVSEKDVEQLCCDNLHRLSRWGWQPLSFHICYTSVVLEGFFLRKCSPKIRANQIKAMRLWKAPLAPHISGLLWYFCISLADSLCALRWAPSVSFWDRNCIHILRKSRGALQAVQSASSCVVCIGVKLRRGGRSKGNVVLHVAGSTLPALSFLLSVGNSPNLWASTAPEPTFFWCLVRSSGWSRDTLQLSSHPGLGTFLSRMCAAGWQCFRLSDIFLWCKITGELLVAGSGGK